MITQRFIVSARLLSAILIASIIAPLPSQGQQKLEWHSFEKALSLAESTGRPILVDVWAPWCGWCLKMKRSVYPDLTPELTENFILTRLNRDDHETMYRYNGQKLSSFLLAQKLKAKSVPTVVLLSDEGNYLLHISGFVEAAQLQPVLEYIGSGAYRQVSFTDFQSK